MSEKLMLVVGVPESHLEALLHAIADAGGGEVGEYTHCSFSNPGTGRFMPSAAANPTLGQRGEINQEAEIRIETFCQRDKAKVIVTAIRAAHPYEEPVIYLIPLLDENAL